MRCYIRCLGASRDALGAHFPLTPVLRSLHNPVSATLSPIRRRTRCPAHHACQRPPKHRLVGVTARQVEHHPPRRDNHPGRHLEQPQTDRPHLARASSVPANVVRRNACTSTYAAELNNNRNWLARNRWQLVRSANRSNCCSLIRFSISPRWQYTSSYNSCGSPGSFATTNRGFEPWALCSPLTITRRGRSQLPAA